MTDLLALVVVALGVAVVVLWRRLQALERIVATLPIGIVEPAAPAAPVAVAASAAPPDPAPAPRAYTLEPAPRSDAPARPTLRERYATLSFEQLVGGRLPIWVGGIALVVSAIFLVRLSIEAGWLGPAIRTLLAAAFAVALLAGGEAARRLPPTRDDPRVGQVLAGAGIASAYATLYLAAALYDLVSPLAGFVLMLGVTALGLFLSLRHGPPTAVMALVGGFAAPLVAGFGSVGVPALIVYLALFVAALFWLSIVRRWAWLAIAATLAGFGWSAFLIALVPAADLPGIGGFLVALALAATLAAPRTGIAGAWLRAAPIALALVLALAIAPALDFGALAWSFHLVLAAAALFLARRDAALLPAALAGALLVPLLVAFGMAAAVPGATPIAAIVATLLFSGAGGAFSRERREWAAIALLGIGAPALAVQLGDATILPPSAWFAIDLALAAGAAALAWHHRDRAAAGDVGLVGGIAVAALLLALALDQVVPFALATLPAVAALTLIAAAERRLRDPLVAILAIGPWVALLVLAAEPGYAIARMLGHSIGGGTLPWIWLPTVGDTLRLLAFPAAAVLIAGSWSTRLFGPLRTAVATTATLAAVIALYVLAKQPLAIATPPRFESVGYLERALLTQAALVAGWACWRGGRLLPLARALVALAAARIIWFDVIVLNPGLVPQQVGSLPLLNVVTIHFALAATLFWTLPAGRAARLFAATLTLAALIATVRQVAHGTDLTGPVSIAENWGYSAAMLALAIAWLWRGLSAGVGDLRTLGLALLTATTLKVFLIDASALSGVLRILSFMGLGVALIAIGWAYRRVTGDPNPAPPPEPA